MTSRKALWILIVALAAFLVLFDVSFDFEFSLPGEARQLDAGQEARYTACRNERDKKIHEVAFDTIDNPDVQKLYISNNRDIAARECREQFAEKWTVVDRPFHFNVVDLRFRF